jgi:pimeloyl-ACP methyl ester carboxylesterase
VVVYGESLGSGVAVRLATERPIGGIVLDAPYTSTADVAARIYWFAPVTWLMRDQFRSADIIGAITAPLLVLHGEQDRVIPIGFGERLFAVAHEPKQFVRLPGVGHSDVLEEGGLPAVDAFLTGIEERLPRPRAAVGSDPARPQALPQP